MMAGLFAFAAANEGLVLAALAVLVVLVVLLMALVLVHGRKRVEFAKDEKADLELAALPSTEIREEEEQRKAKAVAETRSLRKLLRAGIAGYHEAYARDLYLMPWVLRLGQSDDAGLLAALEDVHPAVGDAGREGLAWHYYLHGAMIDVANANALAEFLRFAVRHRPGMPLDGILLTVPLTALADVRAATAAGTQLYDQLWNIQRQLGFAVPVYVAITGMEALEGFREFERVLPEGLRGGMLGWSSPYALEAAFTPEYVTEALQSVDQAMLSATLELFSHVMGTDQGTRLVRTREDLTAMDEPLRKLLGIAFRRTAYQESLYFRGVYFTLRPEPDAPASMVHDLVEHKIFAERSLSRPLRSGAQSRRLQRWLWPAATGVVGLAAIASIWISLARLAEYREVVAPALRATAADVAAVALRPDQGADTAAADKDATIRFLRNATMIDETEPVLMMPLSWFGADPYGVRAAMRAGWRGIAVQTLKLLIQQRLQALPTADDSDGSSTDNLSHFLGNVIQADTMTGAFNDLARGGTRAPVGSLIQYALGFAAPDATLDRLAAWGAIGPDAPAASDPTVAIDPTQYTQADLTAFGTLADAYFHTLALGGEATARLSTVSRELGELSRGLQRGDAAVKGFTEAWSGLQEAALGLSEAGPSWIGAASPIIPPDMNALINQAAASPLLGPSAPQTAGQLAQNRYNEVKDQIVAFDSAIGPLVTRAANGTVSLSPAADGLRALLGQWLGASFMRLPAPASPNLGGTNSGYGWDQTALEAVPPLFEDYLLFLSRNLPQVPTQLRAIVNQTAQYQLNVNVQAALAAAAAPAGADNAAETASIDDLRSWSASLRTAFPVLEQAVQSFTQIGMDAQADQLRDRVAAMAGAIVRRVDRMADDDQLYLPNRAYLAGWQGGALSAAGLMGQADDGTLNQYLTSARLEMSTLARDIASPMLELLSRPDMQNDGAYPLASKWQAIVSALDQYDGSRPNSSLLALEKFITSGVPAINDQNCQQTASLPYGPEDFFQERLDSLKNAIYDRCLAVTDSRLIAGYQALQSQFADKLAGHAPFLPANAVNAATAPPALASDIHDFYTLLDTHKADVVQRLATITATRPEWRGPARFLAMMSAARPLLEQLADPAPASSLALVPSFRVDRDHETGGADIIEWRLSSDSATQSSLAAPGSLAWAPGSALGLTLRWAKDGPVTPIAGAPTANAPTVDGLNASFQSRGPWALLDFLGAYAADLPPPQAGQGLLAFTVQTSPRTGVTGAPLPPSSVARVYMAVTVNRTSVTDGQRRVESLPVTNLPTSAPPLPEPPVPLTLMLPRAQGAASLTDGGRANGGASLAPTAIDRAVFGLGDPVPSPALVGGDAPINDDGESDAP